MLFFFFFAMVREKISDANRNSLNDECSVPFNAPATHHKSLILHICRAQPATVAV